MDSVRGRADRKGHPPPPLPIKQRRSLYSGGSSLSSSLDLEQEETFSPLGFRHRAHTVSDVFSTPMDCHAPQCPIHQRPGSCYSHQGRFFSEIIPPPVPKKRLVRALSLPGGCLHPHCSLPSRPLNYDNPLYMLAPIKDLQTDTEGEEPTVVNESPLPSQPLALLSFDTPDFQLPCFFQNFQDQGQVSLDIQQRLLLFLKSIAQRVQTLALCGPESIKGVESFQPQEFHLCEGYQSKKIGGAVFYPVHCPKLPGRVFSAKAYRPNIGITTLTFSKPLPPHPNIQHLLVHYPQFPWSERYTSTVNLQVTNSAAGPQIRKLQYPQSPCDDSTDLHGQLKESPPCNGCTVQSLLSEACELAEGLQHLRRHAATCTELQPQNVALAWPGREREGEAEGGEMEETEGADEQGMSDRDSVEIEQVKRGGCGEERGEGDNLNTSIQELWKRWGPPRVVITSSQPLSESDRNAPSEELRFGSLLRHCLHLPENPTLQDPRASPYSHGLLQLASLLLDPESGVQMADTTGILQALLWGPKADLFQQSLPEPGLLHSWLAVKRSLLVQKLAELGLSEDGRRPDNEDCLCLQYLSLVDPDRMLKIAALMELHHIAH
ncbi:hypothetical protein AAFF_G00005590 [Aldrovandia affinis]|uniref:Uncharacterized protein n=1 Tax=Aldrovandia affinis TaxID=143900 RepID=A0AAD7TDK5_9TELE|nr:hypothetical protein AAFF_G00005590 [Aldrovandia affinis]